MELSRPDMLMDEELVVVTINYRHNLILILIIIIIHIIIITDIKLILNIQHQHYPINDSNKYCHHHECPHGLIQARSPGLPGHRLLQVTSHMLL